MGILSIKSQFSRPAPSSILAITRTIRGRKLRLDSTDFSTQFPSSRVVAKWNFYRYQNIFGNKEERGFSALLASQRASFACNRYVCKGKPRSVRSTVLGHDKIPLYSSLKLPVPGYPPLSRYTLVTYTRTCSYEYAGESRRIGKKEERKGKDERGETRKSVFVENAIKDDGWTRMEWQRSEGGERKHTLLESGKALLLEWVSFWNGLYRGGQGEENVSHFSKRRVATILLCISFGRSLWDTSTHTSLSQTRNGRSGCGVTRGEMYRRTGGLRKVERGILTPRIMARPRGAPN